MQPYVKTVYANDSAPAVSAENLNKSEQGIFESSFALLGQISIPNSLDITLLKGVSGVGSCLYSILYGKKLVIQSGSRKIIDDDSECVYLFEKGLGWVVNDTSDIRVYLKTDLTSVVDGKNANVPFNLNSLLSTQVLAINKTGMHMLDLDFLNDSKMPNVEKSLNIPKTNFSTNSYTAGINSFGGNTKAFAPFKFTGKVKATNCNVYTKYNADGTVASSGGTASAITLNNEIICIFSNDIANASLELELTSGEIFDIKNEVDDLDTSKLYDIFYRNNDINVELFKNKKVDVISTNNYQLVDDDNYISIKFNVDSMVYLFNHDILQYAIIDKANNKGVSITNYYNNGLNSLSSYYTKKAKDEAGHVVISVLKTDFNDFKIDYFKTKTSGNNNLITQVLPFEIYGNTAIRYNADWKCTNIITTNGYVNVAPTTSAENCYFCDIDNSFAISNRTAWDLTHYAQRSIINKSRYVVAFPSSLGSSVAVTAEVFNDAPSYTDLYSNALSSNELSLTATKLKILPEHSSIYWKSKKFAFLGDSLTQDAPYYPYLVKAMDLKNFAAVGMGGTSMEGSGVNSMWQDVRINAIPDNTDIVIIMAGTNGAGALGELTLENHDTDSFIGAYNVCLSKIYYRFKMSEGYYDEIDYSGINQAENAKDIQIIVITPPYLQDHDNQLQKIYSRGAAIKQMSLLWGLPCIDSIPLMQTNPFNDTIAFDNDQTHYNARNRKKLADAIIGEIRKIEMIAENY